MNKLDHLVPKIKRHLRQFHKPGVLFVRPGYCVENGWPTREEAIVVVTSPAAARPDVPANIEGTRVEVRPATSLEEVTHENPGVVSRAADHRVELRASML